MEGVFLRAILATGVGSNRLHVWYAFPENVRCFRGKRTIIPFPMIDRPRMESRNLQIREALMFLRSVDPKFPRANRSLVELEVSTFWSYHWPGLH
jgi:hypothetical protein